MSTAVPRALIIGYIWPEPQSSAAGLRDWNLIDTFTNARWDLTYVSASQENSFSTQIRDRGISIATIQQNHSSFDKFVRELNPDYVIFDRFVTEEQFGWKVEEQCPDAVRIVDSQDLHFLRRAREEACRNGLGHEEIKNCKFNWMTETALREIASFLRSDCTLILSDFEKSLLVDHLKLNEEMFFLSRFHYSRPPLSPEFNARSGFMMIGNFRHPPNADGILWFHRDIWPRIRKKLPSATVTIYGAYPPKQIMELTNPDLGFYVSGPITDQFEALEKARVNLAPLRFGAGIKGKITDGWWAGTPVVTTPIGAEGMHENLPWGGKIAANPDDFADQAVLMHETETTWKSMQNNGYTILDQFYSKERNSKSLIDHFIRIRNELGSLRQKNVIGNILKFHNYRSTKYFSKWIEEKQRLVTKDIANCHPDLAQS